MRVRNLLSGMEFDAEITTEHAACSYRQAAVIVDGEAIDPIGIEIVEASPEELAALPYHWRAAVA